MTKTDSIFAGSIPALYDKYLGPLIFEPYADDLAGRLSSLGSGRILETAAGSGPRELAEGGCTGPAVCG
jgi:hypothetical protein